MEEDTTPLTHTNVPESTVGTSSTMIQTPQEPTEFTEQQMKEVATEATSATVEESGAEKADDTVAGETEEPSDGVDSQIPSSTVEDSPAKAEEGDGTGPRPVFELNASVSSPIPNSTPEEEPAVVERPAEQEPEEDKASATPTRRPVLRKSTPAVHPSEEEQLSAHLSDTIEHRVAHYLHARMAGSPFFQSSSVSALPVLDIAEVNLGHLLGQGEFGRVREVIEISDKAGHDITRLLRESRHTSHHQAKPHARLSTGTTSTVSSHDPLSSSTQLVMADESQSSDAEDSFCNYDGLDTIPDAEPSNSSTGKDDEDVSIEFVEIEQARRARKVLKKRCWREGKARYAVKQLKEELLVPANDNDEFHMGTIGAMDLAMEAALLSRLSHPNIVKLRATAGVPGRPNYMLLMDRLYTTLDHQIEEWKLEQPTSNRIKQFFGKGGTWSITQKLTAKKQHKGADCKDFSRREDSTLKSNSQAANRLIRQGQLLHRLYAAFDAARALRYLHQHKICYRDLKPQNIAFDIRGDVRIFDFGLAKEFVEADLVQYPDDYNATGMTGSRRWMSPEVYFCEAYGLSADVYSFGLLLWNLCTLETPFGDNLTLKSHHNKVMVKGQRPKKPRSKLIPPNLWMLMTMCWAKEREERPTMDIVCDVLRESIAGIKMDIQQAIGTSQKAAAPCSAAGDNPASAALDATGATQTMDLSAIFSSRNNSHNTASTVASTPNSSFRFSSGKSTSKREGPILKLFASRRKGEAEDPVNVSYHHHHPTKGRSNARSREQRQGQVAPTPRRRHSRFLPKGFQLRNSDLEERSEYLLDKSLRSLANMQVSSANLGSSAGSRRSSRNMYHSASPLFAGGGNSPKSHRRTLFGGGDSVWSVVTTGQ